MNCCILLSLLAADPIAFCSTEYTKTKLFDKTPDEVFAAADKLVRGDHTIRVVERDEQRRTIDRRSGKTKGILRMGKLDRHLPPLPASLKPTHTVESNFAKDFFRRLNAELRP